MARMKFMNTEIDNLTMDEALRRIDELIQEDRCAYVVTPNVDHIVKLEHDKELHKAYKHADLILTDGKPLIWISRLYGTPIKQKLSGSDLFPRVCELAAEKGYRVFFLGAAEGVAEKAAQNLIKQFPKLKIVGTYSPSIGFEKDTNELEYMINLVKSVSPQVLIVGLGCPKQELFIYNYRERLEVPISLGLGAVLDFASENVRRAPKWMSDYGLEWFFRLIHEPRRMAKRYLIDDLRILSMVFKYGTNK